MANAATVVPRRIQQIDRIGPIVSFNYFERIKSKRNAFFYISYSYLFSSIQIDIPNFNLILTISKNKCILTNRYNRFNIILTIEIEKNINSIYQ
jgi:hypothetical protein